MSRERYLNINVVQFVLATFRLSTREVGAVGMLLFSLEPVDWDDDHGNAQRTRQRLSSWRKMKPSVREACEQIHIREGWRGSHDGRKWLSPSLRRLIRDRDGERCAYCGTTEAQFHIDHIHPVAKGGTNDPSNLTIACAPCNMSKGERLLSEWRQ